MHALEVGERFPGASFPRADAGEYLYYDVGHELRLFWSRPKAREVRSVRQGACEFGLLYEEDLICLAYRFGPEPVSEAIYSWHLVPEERRQVPPEAEPGPEERALLTVVLVDATTGIVRALRGVTFSPEFTRALHARIRQQAETGVATVVASVGAYFQRARAIRARYPTSETLLAATSIRTSSAGGG